MLEIIPAILTNDPKELEEKIRQVEGFVKRVHIDIIDGVFADNKTVSLDALSKIDTGLLIDVHLMTKDPTDWVEHAVRAMADRVIGQIEMMTSQEAFAAKCQEAGLGVGLGIDIGTDVERLEPALLRDLDLVLVMGVKAGFGGQEFQDHILEKVKKLDEIRARDDTPFKLCVDGGVAVDTVEKIVKAGADEVASGGAVYKGDVEKNLKEIMEAAYR